jgi:protein-tyrosine-phosphatase
MVMTANKNPFDILIVCTGNICRSPMAEGLLKHFVFPKWNGCLHVHSAGTFGLDGNRAEPNAVQTMAQMGIDIRSHRARSIDEYMIQAADSIVVMEEMHRDYIRAVLPQAAEKVRLLGEFSRSDGPPEVADPYGGPLQRYHTCARFMQERISGLADYITQTFSEDDPV